MLETSKDSKRATVLHALGSILAIGLLVALFRQQGWDEILQAIQRISPWRLALAIALTLASRIAVAGRWHVLLVAAGLNIPFPQTLKITFAGLFASQFLPTTVGGDVIRLGSVVRLGYARAISVASLIVDRLIGMAGMAMAGVSLLFQVSIIQSLSNLLLSSTKKPISYLLLIHPTLFLFSVNSQNQSSINRLGSKLWYYAHRLGSAILIWNKHPKALLMSFACTWIHMLCLFGSIWLFILPLGENMGFWMVAGLWSLTYFITLLPISVNGFGVQELSFAFFYTQLGGIQLANALTIALLVRVILMVASLPGALVIPGLIAGDKQQ